MNEYLDFIRLKIRKPIQSIKATNEIFKMKKKNIFNGISNQNKLKPEHKIHFGKNRVNIAKQIISSIAKQHSILFELFILFSPNIKAGKRTTRLI